MRNHILHRLSPWGFEVLCSGNNANVKSMTGAVWPLDTVQGWVAQTLTLALTLEAVWPWRIYASSLCPF